MLSRNTPNHLHRARPPEIASASHATFHPFPRLPFELRRCIYLMATPPRLVMVRSDPPFPVPKKKEYSLFSTAPIPRLLHTCFESRRTLVEYGYQLAFRTPFAEPRTWFHFDHDVVYMNGSPPDTAWERIYLNERHWVDCPRCRCPIHTRFLDSYDLVRIRRLALIDTDFPSDFEVTVSFEIQSPPMELTSALQHCQHLEELFLVQERVSRHETLCRFSGRLFGGRGIQETTLETWELMECDEADVMPPLIAEKTRDIRLVHSIVSKLSNAIPDPWWRYAMFIVWRDTHGGSHEGFFEHYSLKAEEALRRQRDQYLEESPRYTESWNIPKLRFAIVGRPSVLQAVRRARSTYHRALEYLPPSESGGGKWFRLNMPPGWDPDQPGSWERQVQEAETWEKDLVDEAAELMERHDFQRYKVECLELDALIDRYHQCLELERRISQHHVTAREAIDGAAEGARLQLEVDRRPGTDERVGSHSQGV
ncbi:hypothetical protein QBC34DRAFT_414544 [Podospora aff. communis PSN243]|uniref:2EXR domain-containing protein n=1 Tax=Podospora aff. communis PSN243 TaxID=3040156 RepID=A0AAV9G9B9_9PEZI|nr:hypothetical protein QBC34DRAFT_414544 [Podospora aff. communis PSN243]